MEKTEKKKRTKICYCKKFVLSCPKWIASSKTKQFHVGLGKISETEESTRNRSENQGPEPDRIRINNRMDPKLMYPKNWYPTRSETRTERVSEDIRNVNIYLQILFIIIYNYFINLNLNYNILFIFNTFCVFLDKIW